MTAPSSRWPATTTARPRTHDHDHHHDHDGHAHTETVSLEQKVLAKNDLLAEKNRQWLAERGILAFNITSSPARARRRCSSAPSANSSTNRPVSVIEGDQETLLDAERIRAAGARAVQVNTGAGCHLDAAMVQPCARDAGPAAGVAAVHRERRQSRLPGMFDLGELSKVVVVSVTEGADKPLKYPHMFAAAGLVIVNKIDLLPYVDFDLEACRRHAQVGQPRRQYFADIRNDR